MHTASSITARRTGKTCRRCLRADPRCEPTWSAICSVAYWHGIRSIVMLKLIRMFSNASACTSGDGSVEGPREAEHMADHVFGSAVLGVLLAHEPEDRDDGEDRDQAAHLGRLGHVVRHLAEEVGVAEAHRRATHARRRGVPQSANVRRGREIVHARRATGDGSGSRRELHCVATAISRGVIKTESSRRRSGRTACGKSSFQTSKNSREKKMENFSADDAQRLVDIHKRAPRRPGGAAARGPGSLPAVAAAFFSDVLAQIGDVKMEARHVKKHPKKIVFIRGA